MRCYENGNSLLCPPETEPCRSLCTCSFSFCKVYSHGIALCKGRVEAAHLGNPVAGAVRSELRIARPLSTGKRSAHMQLMAGLFHACARTFHDPCSFSPPYAKSTRFFLCNWPVHPRFGLLEPPTYWVQYANSLSMRRFRKLPRLGRCCLKPQFSSQMAAPRAFRSFCSANGRFQEAAPSLFLTTQKAAERGSCFAGLRPGAQAEGKTRETANGRKAACLNHTERRV